MKSTRYQFEVKSDDMVRIDKYLSECLPDISRAKIKRLIEAGFVTLDGVTVEKAGLKAKPGDQLDILLMLEQDSGLVPERLPLDIIFENDQIIVVNKPSGMVVHPGAGNQYGHVGQCFAGTFSADQGCRGGRSTRDRASFG